MDDTTGRELGKALVGAVKRGVKVFAILDGNLTDPRFYARLRLGGVKVVRFNKIFKRDRKHRMHMKAVITDSRSAVLGGMNLSDDYNLGDGQNHYFKDTDLLVHGDAAMQAALHFQSLWRDLKPDSQGPEVAWQDMQPITDYRRSVARFIAQESDEGSSAIRDYYIRCFYAARERIIWHVNNLNPKGPLIPALKAAVDRGVRVICITNSIKATGGLYGEKIGDAWYKVLSRNRMGLADVGVELHELDVPVHSKALVVDGVMASVGSYNLGSSKSDVNLESTFVVYDAQLVGQVEAMLDRDLARSTRWLPDED
jgi:cardiolipin synthase